jgi:tetratricopeptide (TPR) repeat protein
MHPLLNTRTGISLLAALAAFALLSFAQGTEGAAPAAQAGQPAAQPGAAKPAAAEKKVKDQGEYELFNGVLKATDPNAKVKLLEQWREKYPNSDFKDDRLRYLVETYALAGRYQDSIRAAEELLTLNLPPNDIKRMIALFHIVNLTPAVYAAAAPPADALSAAEKAAQGLLGAPKPEGVKDEDWPKAKTDLDWRAHKTLGWVGWQRKNYDMAEQNFTKSLQLNPNQGETSYWFGTALVQTGKPDKQAQGLFEFARAVELPAAQGGLPDEVRKKLDEYLTRTYGKYHGSAEGLPEMKTTARTQAIPPAGFSIKSGTELAYEKEEELKKTNPQLALWLSVRKELTGPNGDQYFESSMKGAGLPTMKGTLLEAKPEKGPKELVLAIIDENTPEVVLKLDEPLTGKPKIGSSVSFDKGVPTAFTKEPFRVTIEVEKANMKGPDMEAPPAPARKAPPKKGAAKK